MGIIKAIGSAISGGLADQWLEVFEADDMLSLIHISEPTRH